jgi:hypothetical protein
MTKHIAQDQCHGVNKQGKRCGATRMSNWGKPTHLVDVPAWYCHRHKDQS